MSGHDRLILVASVAIALAIVVLAFVAARRRALSDSLKTKARLAVEAHRETLMRRRTTLVRIDDYGIADRRRWEREIDHFVSQVIEPTLGRAELSLLPAMRTELCEGIEALIAAAGETLSEADAAVANLSPDAFEAHCAQALLSLGWAARITGQSGDQGADIIAERDGRRVVVQCKLVQRPVGNKAVQEAYAARRHFGAAGAIVVTNADFTRAARDLAATTDVALLHYSQLAEIDRFLRDERAPRPRRSIG